MVTCYNCAVELTIDVSSREHIIPNAIGGHLKSKFLLCHNCNQLTAKPEAGFAKKLNHYTVLLQVERDRGLGRGIEVKSPLVPGSHIVDPKLNLISKGPAYDYKVTGGQFNLKVTADDKDQMESIVKKILLEHPEIDRKSRRKIKRKANKSKVRLMRINQFVHTPTFFDRNEMRIVCKSAVSFYLLNGGFRENIKGLLTFIFDGGPNRCVLFANPGDVEIKDLGPGTTYHSIVLRGDKASRILTAYVEYFELYKFHVLLSDEYDGEDFFGKYIYDVYSRIEVEKEVRFNISPDEIRAGFKYMEHGCLSPVVWEKLWWLMKAKDDEKRADGE